ncbi:MAG: S41 family peptidase [Chitinispirillales bacterium]|jgi:carboxyl-terminal processing protease|nr:S41 family peptidase [Chitinispirillales bacterium]
MKDSTDQRQSRKVFTGIPMMGLVVLIVAFVGLVVDSTKAGGDNFFADVMRMDNVAARIHQNYVNDVSSKDLVDNAIKGMMNALDPHTTYFEAKEYEDLRVQTEGKFGGLGIQISIRDKVLTVMTPISGTPAHRAGIQSGDQIIRIDGASTRGITTDKAVSKLRGEPGTTVNILIRRKGEAQDLEYTIKREIIHLKSVPFYGILENDIGYVVLQQFSQDAGAEIEKAIKELLKKNIKGLVFDLRHNPGGLLPQSIEVSEKFLPRRSLVVSTKGRVRNQNKEFHSSSNPVLPADMPLVVMVDRASASASEIVAGAIQDWDRGIIVGDTTFGKGSVQSVLPLDAANHLKITTAFYYTPAGRCINRAENFIRKDADGEDETEELEEEHEGKSPDPKEKQKADADTTVYRTKGGRTVYGGGGIVPDTIVERKILDMPVRALLIKDMFFQFANNEYVKLQKRNVKLTPGFQVDEAMMKDFYDFLDSTQFTYQSLAQLQFNEFKKRSGIIEDTAASKEKNLQHLELPKLSAAELKTLKASAEQMDLVLAEESKRALKENDAEIRRFVRNALLIREFGQDNEAVYRAKLAHDEQLAAAMSILINKNTYSRLLKQPTSAKQGTENKAPAKQGTGKKK